MPDQSKESSASAPRTRSVLFVCTGNTCRSPLAESLCKRLLADRLGCGVAELESRGFVVRSAGVAASSGDAASEGSVVVAPEFGASLDAHRSNVVNPEVLDAATDVFVMSRSHQYALEMRHPGVGPAPRLLCGDEGDLEDPIGGDVEQYRSCARTIHRHLHRIISEWLDS